MSEKLGICDYHKELHPANSVHPRPNIVSGGVEAVRCVNWREPVASPQATRADDETQPEPVRNWHILCATCGENWGHHMGNNCDSLDTGRKFVPVDAAQPAAGTTPQGMVTAIGIFNSGFLQHVSTTRLDAETWARHHLADSPEVEIKRMTFYPAPDPPEPSKGTTPQAERPNPNCPLCQGLGSWVEGQPCGCVKARAVAPVETPEVELQTLLDAGFNGFAVQLLAEELTRKKDFDTWKTPIKFTFRGVRFTLEKVM